MKYLAAYALLTLSGKKDINAADLKAVLSSVQSNVNDDDLNRVIASLKGKSVHQLIAEGQAKIGGSGAHVAAGNKPGKEAKEAPKKEEAKKKQQPKKKEEAPKEEEEDFGLGGGLFD